MSSPARGLTIHGSMALSARYWARHRLGGCLHKNILDRLLYRQVHLMGLHFLQQTYVEKPTPVFFEFLFQCFSNGHPLACMMFCFNDGPPSVALSPRDQQGRQGDGSHGVQSWSPGVVGTQSLWTKPGRTSSILEHPPSSHRLKNPGSTILVRYPW